MGKEDRLIKHIQEDSMFRIEGDIRRAKQRENYKPIDKYDINIFNQGMQWFNSGLPLEEAPDNVKTNTNFVKGYNKAKRIRDVENYLYDLGTSFYMDGIPVEAIPERYRENPFVLKGYTDSKSRR